MDAGARAVGGNGSGDAAAFDHGWGASLPGSAQLRGARVENADALAALEARARHDLACLNFPPRNWVPPRAAPDGATVLDALVVGGGMCGQTAAFALLREGVSNLRVIDRCEAGREGPWGTFARMETLRSPKHLTGPDLGVPSLTFRAWYEARFGEAGWASLYKVWRLDWLDYLLWVRRVVGVPVENGTELRTLEPGPGGVLVARLRGPRGDETVHVRKVVLALGREGSGAPRWPDFRSFDPRDAAARARVFHSAEPIDFAALRGRRVGVLGAGASAFDNAGVALESGAGEVVMFARRAALPQVNKSKWTSFPGFFHGFCALPDDARWRFYTYILDEQVPPPFESVLRCDRHPDFALRLGQSWEDLAPDADGVAVRTPAGVERFDAVIVATGFDVDLLERPEIDALRDDIMLWSHRVDPAAAAAHPEAARFPYLGDGLELRSRRPETAPALAAIHLFNWGSTMSHGAIAGDIPGLAVGAGRLAVAVARDLFLADAPRFVEMLHAHDEPELRPTRWYVGPR